MNCRFCNKECKNKNSLIHHERLCKSNPNKKESPFLKYNENVRSGLVKKENTNHWVKAKNNGTSCIMSEETKNKLRISSSCKKHSEETKKKISEIRKAYLKEHPEMVPYKLNHYSKGDSYPEKYFEELFEKENIPLMKKKQVGLYELDFYNEELKVYVEIDGDQHYLDKRIVESDIRRTKILEELGWKVYRVKWSYYQTLSYQDKNKIVLEIKNLLRL